jgi:hypothetical protein
VIREQHWQAREEWRPRGDTDETMRELMGEERRGCLRLLTCSAAQTIWELWLKRGDETLRGIISI